MPVSAKTVYKQLMHLKPYLSGRSISSARKSQHRLGEFMENRFKKEVISKSHSFENFEGAWLLPRDERRDGVILYLHGGGYAFGDIDYAKGFGSMLADQTGARVFCAGYRLAPEHPYPAALDDALAAFDYLVQKGYSPQNIALFGDSAGGGLCYALCLKLRELGAELPCGIIAHSPWIDLTASGKSYEENKETDPTLTKESLQFYASLYTEDPKNPLVSPLFANLEGLPPSLVIAAENELLASDAANLHRALAEAGCKSKLVLTPKRWHVYLLYGLSEDQKDFITINKFLNATLGQENKLRWMRLDNAGKMYPATRSEEWSNLFRVSATLDREIDKEVMQSALDVTARRFPSIAVRLRKGFFWYYLQQLSSPPTLTEEKSYPLTRMSKKETRKCAFRVIVYKKRVALEVFHSITDGGGALVFLKSLVAEYLWQKYGEVIPAEKGVLGRLDYPAEAELEDSFQKHVGAVSAKRKERPAWRIGGTLETAGFLNLTCFELSVSEAIAKAHEYGVSLTTFLCAVMMSALQDLQKEKFPRAGKRKPIKIRIPADLRRVYGSETLRNFVLFTIPEILPALGEYSFEEICRIVHHKLGADITAKQMSMRIATNIRSESIMAARIMPLFVKNIIIKASFNSVGERQACFTLSNLGAVKIPKEMEGFIDRFDFVLGPQSKAPHNCGVVSYGDRLFLNFIRNIKESELEYHVFKTLQGLGLSVTVQSNLSSEEE